MDIWRTFGIETIYPSHLTKWEGCRGAWYAHTRAKVYDDAGPAAWRGDAVEAGLWAFSMERPNASRTAFDVFDKRDEEWSQKHDGEFHPTSKEERDVIERTLERAIAGWEKEGFGKPLAYQIKCEGFLPGTRVKIGGKPDFACQPIIPNTDLPALPFCVDLKTAYQIPSQPKDENETPRAKVDHAIAASIYAHLRGEESARLLYVSTAEKPKTTYRAITLDKKEIDFFVNASAEIIKQIEATLWAAEAMTEFEIVSREDALARLCRPNMLAQGGGLYPIWRSEYAERARAAVPAWK